MKDNFFIEVIEAFFLFCLLLLLAGALILFCRTAMAFPTDWNSRCRPYEHHVKEILESEGVSSDFYYLMVAESRCTEDAISESGAKGFWQMMPATAKHYGCSDLSDLECSTHAAARYIKHLESRYKEFDVVIAAYNMGGRNMEKRGMTEDARNLIHTVRRLIDDDN